jgi:hypothetical protein
MDVGISLSLVPQKAVLKAAFGKYTCLGHLRPALESHRQVLEATMFSTLLLLLALSPVGSCLSCRIDPPVLPTQGNLSWPFGTGVFADSTFIWMTVWLLSGFATCWMSKSLNGHRGEWMNKWTLILEVTVGGDSPLSRLAFVFTAKSILLTMGWILLWWLQGRRKENWEWHLQGEEGSKLSRILSKFTALNGVHLVTLPAQRGPSIARGDWFCPSSEPSYLSYITLVLKGGHNCWRVPVGITIS